MNISSIDALKEAPTTVIALEVILLLCLVGIILLVICCQVLRMEGTRNRKDRITAYKVYYKNNKNYPIIYNTIITPTNLENHNI